jgi:AcrR family transcriptional regulator
MPGNKMGEQTKEKILQAAQQEFLEKGFDAAKVDDIARRAGITKAMLYYHFSTKENIFNEIVKKVVVEVRQEFQANMSLADRSNPDQFREHLKSMIAFYHQRQSLIRLVIAEQINNRKQEGVGQLAVFKDVFELILDLAGRESGGDQEEFLIQVFFFNALPMLLYASLSDQFCADFEIAPEKCLNVFTDRFAQSFLSAAAAAK